MGASLRAAVLGVGAMGAHHARLYGEIEGVELVAIADSGDELAAIAERYGCAGYRDYTELLERERPDVVSVAVPTSAHLEVALAALQRRLPRARREADRGHEQPRARSSLSPRSAPVACSRSATSSASTPPCDACAS